MFIFFFSSNRNTGESTLVKHRSCVVIASKDSRLATPTRGIWRQDMGGFSLPRESQLWVMKNSNRCELSRTGSSSVTMMWPRNQIPKRSSWRSDQGSIDLSRILQGSLFLCLKSSLKYRPGSEFSREQLEHSGVLHFVTQELTFLKNSLNLTTHQSSFLPFLIWRWYILTKVNIPEIHLMSWNNSGSNVARI